MALEAFIAFNKGLFYYFKEDTNQAIKHAEYSLELREKLGAKLGIIRSLLLLSWNVGHLKGDLNRAIEYAERGVALAREINNKDTIAFGLRTLAKKTPKDIDVCEVHDAFAILEAIQSEDLGFYKKGEGAKAAYEGLTEIGGKIPINPFGGLKARGYPLGATGIAQVVELVWQLRGESGKKQVEGAETGITCNFGGFGNNILSILVERI